MFQRHVVQLLQHENGPSESGNGQVYKHLSLALVQCLALPLSMN